MQHTCFWNNEILTPIQKHGMEGPGKPAFKKLRILLDRMMLRRTKVRGLLNWAVNERAYDVFSFNAQTTSVCHRGQSSFVVITSRPRNASCTSVFSPTQSGSSTRLSIGGLF